MRKHLLFPLLLASLITVSCNSSEDSSDEKDQPSDSSAKQNATEETVKEEVSSTETAEEPTDSTEGESGGPNYTRYEAFHFDLETFQKALSPKYILDISANHSDGDYGEGTYNFISYELYEGEDVIFKGDLNGAGHYIVKTDYTDYTYHFIADSIDYVVFPRYQGSETEPPALECLVIRGNQVGQYTIEAAYDFFSGPISDELIASIIKQTSM